MLLRSSLLAAFTLLLAIPSPTYGASILCAKDLYGRPLLSDALTISNSLPYVKSDPDHQMDAGRIFAEPAFFTPKFQGLLNTWNSAMVQLPRVWRYSGSSSCASKLTSSFFPSLIIPHDGKKRLFTDSEGSDQDPHASPSSSTPTPPARSPYPASTQTGARSKRLQQAWCSIVLEANRASEACGLYLVSTIGLSFSTCDIAQTDQIARSLPSLPFLFISFHSVLWTQNPLYKTTPTNHQLRPVTCEQTTIKHPTSPSTYSNPAPLSGRS